MVLFSLKHAHLRHGLSRRSFEWVSCGFCGFFCLFLLESADFGQIRQLVSVNQALFGTNVEESISITEFESRDSVLTNGALPNKVEIADVDSELVSGIRDMVENAPSFSFNGCDLVDPEAVDLQLGFNLRDQLRDLVLVFGGVPQLDLALGVRDHELRVIVVQDHVLLGLLVLFDL